MLIPRFHRVRIFLLPFLSGSVKLAKGKFFAGCAVYPAEVVRERLAVFVAYIFQRVPDLMYDAPLIFGLRKGRFYSVLDAGKAVGTDDEDVFYASVLKLIEYGQPMSDKAGQALFRALILPNVDTKNVLVSARRYA